MNEPDRVFGFTEEFLLVLVCVLSSSVCPYLLLHICCLSVASV